MFAPLLGSSHEPRGSLQVADASQSFSCRTKIKSMQASRCTTTLSREDWHCKRLLSFLTAPRTRPSTVLGALEAVFGFGFDLLGAYSLADSIDPGRRVA